MKKLLILALSLILCFSVSACKNDNSDAPAEESQEESMSGINSQVSASPEANGTKYTFEGYFTTVIPYGIKAEDKSINNDAGFFAIYDENTTYMDVTYYETGTSDAELEQKVNEIASSGNSEAVDPITVNENIFYGVSMPSYGKTQYMGCVNGYDVTISIYTDLSDTVVNSFIENTVFTRE